MASGAASNEIVLSVTNQGKPLALHEGYSYRLKKTFKNGNQRWLCSKERSKKCSGSVITAQGIIKKANDHVCKPDVAAVETRQKIQQAKKRAREENISASALFLQEMEPLFNKGYDFVTSIPSHSSLKRTFNRIKERVGGSKKDAEDAKSIVFPKKLLLLEDGSSFLVADEAVGEDRLLIFATPKGLQELEKRSTVFLDGTFKSASKQFRQIYTFHIDIGSNHHETNIIPVLYGLLENKKKTTYEKLFSTIKKLLPRWCPKIIKLDFEMAVISSLIEILPSTVISGCSYHFNQCIWRRVQHLGLTSLYTNNPDVRKHIRMCAALAYIPPDDVEDGFLKIMETTPSLPKLKEFYDYFVNEWLENENISISMWNVYKQRHRSNNAVEGWNHRLNVLLNKPHPNVYDLVAHLKQEANFCDHLLDRQYLNLEGKRRKSTYRLLDERIDRILSEYEITKDLKKCLETLAFVQKLQ